MSMTDVQQWLEALEHQRRALKMPLPILAQRAKLSRATVCRILKEKRLTASLENVLAIARVLGAEIAVHLQTPEDVIEQEVQKRAKKIVQMVQGTMALEAQGITDPILLKQLVETAAREIRAKPRKQLWVNPCRPSNPSRAKHPLPNSRN